MSDYEIRFVEPGDRNAYLDLYQAVLDQPKSAEWFEWKYEHNPYVDHVPIVIARAGDEIVGARSFFALEMRVDGDPRVDLEPCDTMVRTDYRRRGLFTRMTELAIDRYEGRYPLFFNFPNRDTLSGNLDLGWKVVSDRPHYYRIESPAALVAERDGPATLRLAADALRPGVLSAP